MAPSIVAEIWRSKLIQFLYLALLLLGSINSAGGQTGVCYGTQGDGLPSPQTTVSIFKQKNIKRMRIYDPNSNILQAIAGSGIQLMIGIPNSDINGLASNQANADTWVQQNIRAHPDVTFRYIVVGNEIRPNKGDTAQFAASLLQALKNIHYAVFQAGLAGQIKVSTAFDFGILGNSYPPSSGSFDDSIRSFLDPIFQLLTRNGAPVLVNVYPYFSYAGSTQIPLDYALFKASGNVVTDPQNGLGYQNLFDAMVDAIYSALDKAGVGSLSVVVSETGWPTYGGKDTTWPNAEAYNNNLIRSVRGGTPKKGAELETYIFAMYNENRKNPELEKHWGLYNNLVAKYPINF